MAAGVLYTCKARAVNALGAGPKSAGAIARVPSVPVAPGGVTAVPTGEVGQLVVSYTPLTGAQQGGLDVTGYRADCTAAGYPSGTAQDTTAPFDALTVSGLNGGTAYACRVAATNPVGTGPASPRANGTPLSPTTRVTSISPTSGPTAGGTEVTITGSDFTGATAVAFGTTPATDFTVDSATQITATAPARAAGAVNVRVTTSRGTSPIGKASSYTYQLIPNASVEFGSTSPTSWFSRRWRTNDAAFSWPATGGHRGSRFLRVDITDYTNGDGRWFFAPQPIRAGVPYRYVEWYRANAATEVVVEFGLRGGGRTQRWLGDLQPRADWTRYSTTITPPANARTITVWHALRAPGFLETDDFSLAPNISDRLSRPLVTLTFDDGRANHFTAGLPLLEQYGMDGTFYVPSGYVDVDPFMTEAQVLQLRAAGNEIASHTVTHPDLTQISPAQQDVELQQSRASLEALIGAPVPNFAVPYGRFDEPILAKIRAVYGSNRIARPGFNTRYSTDIYRLRVQRVESTTTRAEVEGWLATARAQRSWLILLYHDIEPSPGPIDTTPARLEQHLQAIQASGIAARTMAQALTEVTPQIS